MKHRFFVPDINLDDVTTLTGEELHHAARVVRVREGEEVELFDGRGAIVTARVEALTREKAMLRVTGPVTETRESPLALHLAMAIINLDKFELVLQKATELGVRSIVPIVSERVEIRAERYRGKQERWEKIIFEAVKQCGRARVPELAPPLDFTDAIVRGGVKLFLDADVTPAAAPETLGEATLFIGPEGGWSDEELALARANGALFQRLGPRRLRAETAAIAACTIFAARYGDI
ncbi:MAG: methyltransferase, RsmE family [Acidobacteria bacterium]|nr:methyltransferase, RsmE family [Acidobacteriota bacterium]